MKTFFIIAFFLCCSSKLLAQDTIFVYVDNEKAAQGIVTPIQTNVPLELSKTFTKRSKSIIVQVYGEHIGGQVYRRDLEIAGDSSFTVTETRMGIFDISQSGVKKELLARKTLKLYLRLNPANPNMAIPSKRVYLGNLAMK